MRMKMFAAETADAAKALIFAEMGGDAIILSEREVDGRVEIRAAIDPAGKSEGPRFLHNETNGRPLRLVQDNPLHQRLRDSLLWHGAPSHFAERVADAGAPTYDGDAEPSQSLATGLADFITCAPIPARPEKNILLVGPPGHGRTATAAKLTRRAAVANARLIPLAADLDATAGGDQLAAYLEREQDQIKVAGTPDDLFSMLTELTREDERCVIDLPAIVPFDRDDMASLKDLIAAINAEPVLVISAEGHPEDLADACKAFAGAGVKRAIVTKLDVARRRGGIVSALASANIAFSHLAVTPFIGGGLVPAAPSRIAALLLEDAPAHVAMRGAA